MGETFEIMGPQSNCLICERENARTTCSAAGPLPDNSGMVNRLTCPYCGEYRVLFLFEGGPPTIEPSARYALSMACRRKNIGEKKPDGLCQTLYIDSKETAAGLALDFRVPGDAIEQLDSLLVAFAEFAPNLTQETPEFTPGTWTALVGLPDHNAFRRICALAEEAGYLQAGNTNIESWALTLRGWERVRQIREVTTARYDAFVAMWFHQSMNDIWHHGFHPALANQGWNPVRIDQEHFSGRIDDEILKRIRRSGLLVADITGARHGVYFEAGFALGLGVPVIWTCNQGWRTLLQAEVHSNELTLPRFEEKEWFDVAHFDTKTFQHILWKDAEDLHNQLSTRLEALGLTPRSKSKT